MALPPPMTDPSHLETRLLVVAEMLEKAVAEVRRTMAEVKGYVEPPPGYPPDDSGASRNQTGSTNDD